MIDHRIRTFLTLCETMNYRRTAQLLQLSQPAVTQQIHALEREYGCRLFQYDGRQLHATEQAQRLANYARAAMVSDRQLRAELAHPGLLTVRLGATRTIGDFVLPGRLCGFLQKEDQTLELTVDNTARLLELLEQERLDLALVEGEFNRSRYGWAPFCSSPFSGICRKDHPFAGQTVTLRQLADQSVILREPGSGTRGIFEDTLRRSGGSLRDLGRVICVNSFPLILRMLAEGIGITFAYSAVCAGSQDLALFHLEGMRQTGEFCFVFRKSSRAERLIPLLFPDQGVIR